MNAYDFLNQVRKLNYQIQMRTEELEELKCKMGYKGIDTSTKMSGSNFSSEGFARLIPEVIEIENEIEKKKEERLQARTKIISTIEKLDDSKQIKVLYMYFVQCKSIFKISCNLDCTRESVYRLRNKGIEKVKPLLQSDTNCYKVIQTVTK